MASFLNGFLDNVVSGALSPKGNLGDYAHASRMYVDDNMRLAPKSKFLFHVTFNINREATKSIPQLAEKHLTELGMLVKNVQLPAYQIQTDIKHQYNKKRAVHKRIDYSPVTIQFHDDNFGVTTAMWEAYYRYYFRDGNYSKVSPAGAPEPTIREYQSTKPSFSDEYAAGVSYSQKQYRYGMDNDVSVPFFSSIQIHQLSRKRYTTMTLINPIISGWQHDTMDNSVSDSVTNQMTLEYETVHYSRGPVNNGTPKGFGTDHYDKTSSPNSLSGGGASSLFGVGGVLAGGFGVIDDITSGKANFGTVLKAANTLSNAQGLSLGGLKGELIGQGLDAIGETTGIDVSGVSGLSFPKGAGGGNLKTLATAGAVVGAGKLANDYFSSGANFSSFAAGVRDNLLGADLGRQIGAAAAENQLTGPEFPEE